MDEVWVLLCQALYQSIKEEELLEVHEKLKDVSESFWRRSFRWIPRRCPTPVSLQDQPLTRPPLNKLNERNTTYPKVTNSRRPVKRTQKRTKLNQGPNRIRPKPNIGTTNLNTRPASTAMPPETNGTRNPGILPSRSPIKSKLKGPTSHTTVQNPRNMPNNVEIVNTQVNGRGAL